jgi:hypothetical protein
MRFKKIKMTKEGKIQMEYEIKNQKGGMDEFSFSCFEEPKPSFIEALKDLAQDALDICELPDDYLSRIRISGISLSYGGENETMGCIITAQMILYKSNAALNLNTPHKIEEFYGETGDESQLLSKSCVGRIKTLIDEAGKYAKGIRAQGNLFDQKIKA